MTIDASSEIKSTLDWLERAIKEQRDENEMPSMCVRIYTHISIYL